MIIRCIVKNESKMKQTFNILCESNDSKSKMLYPNNNHMQFKISLPKRYEFGNKPVGVCMKSMHLTNKLFNISDKDDYSMSVKFFEYTHKTQGGQYASSGGMHKQEERKLVITPGNYQTIQALQNEINKLFDANNIPVQVTKIQKSLYQTKISLGWNRRNRSSTTFTFLTIKLSAHLAALLGYTKQLSTGRTFNFNKDEVSNRDITSVDKEDKDT